MVKNAAERYREKETTSRYLHLQGSGRSPEWSSHYRRKGCLVRRERQRRAATTAAAAARFRARKSCHCGVRAIPELDRETAGRTTLTWGRGLTLAIYSY